MDFQKKKKLLTKFQIELKKNSEPKLHKILNRINRLYPNFVTEILSKPKPSISFGQKFKN